MYILDYDLLLCNQHFVHKYQCMGQSTFALYMLHNCCIPNSLYTLVYIQGDFRWMLANMNKSLDYLWICTDYLVHKVMDNMDLSVLMEYLYVKNYFMFMLYCIFNEKKELTLRNYNNRTVSEWISSITIETRTNR